MINTLALENDRSLLEPTVPLGRTQCDHRAESRVVTHAIQLIAALSELPCCHGLQLEKNFGQTQGIDAIQLDEPLWYWPG